MYKLGTIKVAWTKGRNFQEMESLMFESLPQALSYVDGKKDYMIMELIEQDKDYYKWKVLPYGEYTSYKYGMIISESPILLAVISALVVYGAYKLFKK
jgi:hypothetical protein